MTAGYRVQLAKRLWVAKAVKQFDEFRQKISDFFNWCVKKRTFPAYIIDKGVNKYGLVRN